MTSKNTTPGEMVHAKTNLKHVKICVSMFMLHIWSYGEILHEFSSIQSHVHM